VKEGERLVNRGARLVKQGGDFIVGTLPAALERESEQKSKPSPISLEFT